MKQTLANNFPKWQNENNITNIVRDTTFRTNYEP